MQVRVVLVSLGLVVASAATVTAQPATAGPAPLRSGTIAGGTGVFLGGGPPWDHRALKRSGCEYAAECAAWLRSGCSPALAGRNPVLTSSVVHVGRLADGRTSRSLRMAAPEVPPWGLWPGAVVQFWRQDCREVHRAELHTYSSPSCWWAGSIGACTGLRIPTGTRWMTVSAYATTARLSWALV